MAHNQDMHAHSRRTHLGEVLTPSTQLSPSAPIVAMPLEKCSHLSLTNSIVGNRPATIFARAARSGAACIAAPSSFISALPSPEKPSLSLPQCSPGYGCVYN